MKDFFIVYEVPEITPFHTLNIGSGNMSFSEWLKLFSFLTAYSLQRCIRLAIELHQVNQLRMMVGSCPVFSGIVSY